MANEFVAKNGLISQNNTTISGSLTVTQGVTGSLLGTASYASLAPDYVLNSATSSYTKNDQTASFATTGSNSFTGFQTITGSGNLTIKSDAGTQLTMTTTDFGGGSTGTNFFFNLGASTGNTYANIGTRTTGGTGNGTLILNSGGGSIGVGKTTANAAFDVNGNAIITGSLNVTTGITGSLLGSSSYATTASYALNGGGGGVTSITAGNGISVDQSTGNVTITNTGGTGGGLTQGQIVAIATGVSNLF